MTRPTVPEACIAVFDVGKTNKKLLIYDRNFSLLDSTYAQFEEFQTSCELHERIQETGQWLIEALAHMNARYPIGAVSVSAHGGAFVCLDGEGEIAMPVLSYNSDPGEDFHSRFAREYGDPEQLQRVTCSPSMPGLGNMAKGIAYAMQAYPGEFGRTRSILPLPQYYGFLLTGRKTIEHTCLCNHTCLWDFRAQDWSFVAKRLGILDRFPRRLSRPWDVLGRITPALASATGLRTDTIVTVGVHDSNAALLPYLVSRSGSFMLLSTGSVCVAMHPTTEVFLRPDELGKVIFYNGSVFGDPVKTTIFLAGLEFDVYMEMLAGLKGSAEHPAFDRDLCADILKGQGEFILPALVPFGMFPESTARIIEPGRSRSFMEVAGGSIPEFFNDFERAYTVLTLSLAIHTQVALERAGLEKGMPLFIEGGFSRNEVYTSLVASLNPDNEVFLTSLEEASAFGAALLAESALAGTHPRDLRERFTIETLRVASAGLDGLEAYAQAFMHLLETPPQGESTGGDVSLPTV